MTVEPPDWATTTPSTPGVHKEPAKSAQFQNLTQDEINVLRSKLIESLVQVVVQAVTGIFSPGGGVGGALSQLTSWASGLPLIGDLLDAPFISDLLDVLGSNSDFLEIIGNPVQTLIDALIEIFSGIPVVGAPIADLLSEFDGLIGQVDDTTAQADDTAGDFQDLIDGILGGSSNPLSALISFLGSGSGIPDSSTPGIGNILTNVFGAITGLFNGSRSHTEMTDALTSQAGTVTTTSANLAQFLAAIGPGKTDSDSFERTRALSSNGLTAVDGWSFYHSGSGTIGIPNAHDLSWGGSNDDEWVGYRTSVFAAGDAQVTALVFGTSPSTEPILLPTEFGAADLWIRMSNFTTFATRTGVRLRYNTNGTKLRLSSYNSGTESLIGEITVPAANRPTAGTTMMLEANVGGNPRSFRGTIGGLATTWTEAGTSSLYGTSYLRRGCGGFNSNLLLVTARPGTFKQWTAQG